MNEINTYCAIKLIDAFYSIPVENENVSNVSEPIDYSIYRTPSGKEIYIRCIEKNSKEENIVV